MGTEAASVPIRRSGLSPSPAEYVILAQPFRPTRISDMDAMKTPTIAATFALCILLQAGPAAAQETVTGAACVDTNMGEFCMRLLRDEAPRTVDNFLNYVNRGAFDDTFIHRTEPNFVIQGGGYYTEPLGEEVPQDPAVINEFNRSNTR